MALLIKTKSILLLSILSISSIAATGGDRIESVKSNIDDRGKRFSNNNNNNNINLHSHRSEEKSTNVDNDNDIEDAVSILSADNSKDAAKFRLKRQFEEFGGTVDFQNPGTCLSTRGLLGTCTLARQCYPYFRGTDFFRSDNWPFERQSTCSFYSNSGVQVYGVCCDAPFVPFPPPPSAVDSFGEQPDLNNVNVPANWPPALPTHSPDNTIPPLPTHPSSPGLPGFPLTTPSTTTSTTAKPVYWPPTVSTIRPPYVTVPTTTTTAAATDSDTEYATNNETECGIKNGYQDQERIVGGQNAELGEWPWMAAILNNGRLFCGGSLIDDVHILTAAHCVAHMNPWDVARLRVYLGDYNIKVKGEVQHVERRVKKVVRHRGFDPRTLYHDIALLTLDSPVTFTKFIRPICMPHGKSLYNGRIATVIGWGSLREMGPTPAILQEVNLPIWGNSDCKVKYGNTAPGGIVDHFICAGKASKDSCSGDSGGPLMISDGGKWMQIGIVSWGIGCGKGQFPGVYTRMTYFMPWINKNLNT